MKTINFPEPVTYGNEQLLTFADLVRHVLMTDQRFNANGAGIRSAAKVEASLGPELVVLEDADYDRLLAATEDPQPMQGMPPYPVRPARLCAPFLEAIKKAADS